MMRDTCLLCRVELEPISRFGVQRHPELKDRSCQVRFTDAWGVSLSDDQIQAIEVMLDEANEVDAPQEPTLGIFDIHPPVEWVLEQTFKEVGLPRLGGPSTGRGWSSIALAQRCLYAWHKRHIVKERPELAGENDALAIGTLIHVFLALLYANQMKEYLELPPEACRDRLLQQANPAFIKEAWRIFSVYRLYYQKDDFRVLAVEHDLADPRTGESTRYDAVIWCPKDTPGRLAGTYIVEHKSSSRFDADTLDGWANDGEVIGEAALWRRLGLDKRFGPLRGVIINLVGKQKEPKFHRVTVAPEGRLVESHLDDLRRWEGLIQLARSTNSWPRSRANCINRFGRCEWWDHCVTGAP